MLSEEEEEEEDDKGEAERGEGSSQQPGMELASSSDSSRYYESFRFPCSNLAANFFSTSKYVKVAKPNGSTFTLIPVGQSYELIFNWKLKGPKCVVFVFLCH